MKKELRLTIAVGICLVLILAVMPLWSACSTKGPTAENPMILDYASYLPDKYPGSKPTQDFFKEIENITGGAVKTNIHFLASMGPGKEHYDMTVNGICDAAIVSPEYTPGVFPLWSVFALPVNLPSAEVQTKALVQMYKSGVFDKEFTKVKIISMYSLPPYQVASRAKKISTVADFAGVKIRVNGEIMAQGMKNLGAVPVFTTGAEAYADLQKGVTDAVAWPWDGIVASYHLDELCPYITETNYFTSGMMEMMNKETYEALPKAARDYIDNNLESYSLKIAANFDAIASSSKAEFLKKANKEMLTLAPGEREKMDALFAPIWDKWLAEMAAKGLPGEKTLKTLYDIMKGLGVQKPFFGYTPK